LPSPLIIAQFIGAAPLYLGSREAWIFTQPNSGRWIISDGRILPYAATTIAEGFNCFSPLIKSVSLTFNG